MSHYLQKVLDLDERLFNVGLANLEKSTGHSAIDVRLIADITEKTHKIMRKLGLDVRDTTAEELYHALLASVAHNTAEELLTDSDYVLTIIDKKIISFNLIDVIENYHHELSYKNQSISHGQRSLRGELLDRYIKHARTDEITVRSIALAIGLISDKS